jgi:hypothetical protein
VPLLRTNKKRNGQVLARPWAMTKNTTDEKNYFADTRFPASLDYYQRPI